MPTVLSMCHGGIWRAPTRAAIDLAQGRASSYVTSDIGAMLFGRWHDSHFCWKIGATSFVNVTGFPASAAAAGIDETRRAPTASAVETRNITSSFRADDRAGRKNQPPRAGHSIGQKAQFCTPCKVSRVVTFRGIGRAFTRNQWGFAAPGEALVTIDAPGTT